MEQNETVLILHIGAHKTGTTVLQTRVFPFFPGYIGKYERNEDREKSNSFSDRREIELLWLEVYRLWLRDSPRIRGAVRGLIKGLTEFREQSVLISAEDFHSWPRKGDSLGLFLSEKWFRREFVNPHPFLKLLKIIREESVGALRLQVVFTVRNQVDYLGSMYAQISSNLAEPSQADFEKRFQRIIQTRSPQLDWSQFVEGLFSSVGERNTLVLLYEDGLEFNLAEFMKFIGWRGVFSALPKVNVRGGGSRSWEISEKPRKLTLLFQRVWILGLRLSYLRLTRRLARPVWIGVKRLLKQESETSDERNWIVIDEKHAESLIARYADTNRRLSKILGRDLSSLGYAPR